MKNTFFDQCVQDGLLTPFDLVMAERLLSQEENRSDVEKMIACVAVMTRQYRAGDLCVRMASSDGVLMEMAREGGAVLPERLCARLSMDSMEASCPQKPIYQVTNPVTGEVVYYFQKNWALETACALHLQRLLPCPPQIPIEVSVEDSVLNALQKEAVLKGVHSSVSILAGGPGTGKTFTAKQLVKMCLAGLSVDQRKKFRIALTAPTGKAASHLHQKIAPCLDQVDPDRVLFGTLHALLECREGTEKLHEKVLLADLVLVDECSMIDARMWAQLLLSILPGTRLVLIGDHRQLSAVGQGAIFSDLMRGAIPSTCLTECKRVEEDQLLQLGSAIGEEMGCALELMEAYRVDLNRESIEQLMEKIQKYLFFVKQEDAFVECLKELDRFRILSCLRQGEFGVDSLNAHFFSSLSARLPKTGWWAIPILIVKNHHQLNLCNGDVGLLVRKIGGEGDDYALFGGREPIPEMMLPTFEYAYCLSVHKSQGSEYREVALLVPPGSEKFGKEMIYTAITRAKSALRVYGDLNRIETMMKKHEHKQSMLCARVSL